MKIRDLFEKRIPVYVLRDEDAWYEDTRPTDDDVIPTNTPGLRLVGIVLAGGYREGAEGEYIYSKDGRLYVEEVLTGDNRGVATPVHLTLFQLNRYLERVQ